MIDLSRRALIGASAAGAAALATKAGAKEGAPPLLGPAPGVAQLSLNENPYGPGPAALRAITDAATKGCFYPDAANDRLTAMIAERADVAPEQVVLGNGSFEVLTAAAMAWGRGGAILSPELLFDAPIQQVAPLGIQRVTVPLAADMGIDLAALAARVAPGVSLVYLCNPNNPTGMSLDPAALRSFVRGLPTGTPVLIDEAYNELTDAPGTATMLDLVRDEQNVIVTRTFSKIYGLAGLRVGYAIASRENAARIRAHLGTIGVNSAAVAAAIASFDDTAFLRFSRERILEARGIILEAARRAGLRTLPSQTNFVFVEVPDADKLRDAMAARGITIRGAYGKWRTWSRVSTGRIEDVRRYAAALPELVRA